SSAFASVCRLSHRDGTRKGTRRELLASRFTRTPSLAAVGARGRGLLRAAAPPEQGAQSDEADLRYRVAAIRDPSDAQTRAQGPGRRRQPLQRREMRLKS